MNDGQTESRQGRRHWTVPAVGRKSAAGRFENQLTTGGNAVASKCKICGSDDLFTACTGEPACAICTMKFVGGGPQTDDVIKAVRKRLGLADGEFLELDHGAEAARILGR